MIRQKLEKVDSEWGVKPQIWGAENNSEGGVESSAPGHEEKNRRLASTRKRSRHLSRGA